MHQAVARDAVAAFERRDVVGAKLHFGVLEFIAIDAVLANFVEHCVVRGERLLGGIFGLVEEAPDQQRRPVVIEKIADRIIDAAAGVHGDLLFEDQLAIDAAGAAAVERLVEHGQRVPVGRAASRRAVADGDAGQRAEFFLDFAAALALEGRFADVGGGPGRAGGDALEMALARARNPPPG